jgi:hypothetical protein
MHGLTVWISGNDIAIFRVGNAPEHGIPLQDFKHPMIFWQNVEESCTFQKIYGVGKVKLQIKWPGRLAKNTNLVEILKEIN